MNRKICVITGSRAEYGLLRWVMQEIKDSENLELQLIACGMHLSEAFGSTLSEIENDGFKVNYKVDVLDSIDSSLGVTTAMSRGLVGFAEAFEVLKPDVIVVLGDRFEIFSAVTAALIAKIPVAHIHGGEITIGAFDDALRHCITKMSHLHFVATQDYKNRVVQLGENPKTVFVVGGLGIENVDKLKLLSKYELEKALNLKFENKSLLVTLHPVTLDEITPLEHINELLVALDGLKDTTLIFTSPNADPGGSVIRKKIDEFVKKKSNAHFFASLGQQKYLSSLAHVNGVLGNSSSGILEAPSFKKGTINIGDRQKGRTQSTSIINCLPTKESILEALETLFSDEFQKSLSSTTNPYGVGNSSKEVVKVLNSISLEGIIKKEFYDIKDYS
jgi:GDP/UDP-N,N'-diacetylbacillosamine 2-epimerase (hydrolysing)